MITNIEEHVRIKTLQEFNSFLDSKELRPLKLLDGAPSIDSETYAMGIYMFSPNGSIFENDGSTIKSSITFDCHLDTDINSSSLSTRYLDALLEWTSSCPFEMDFTISLGLVRRVDTGDVDNGFAALMEVVIDYLHDDSVY